MVQALPETFYTRFEKLIPDKVKLSLKNGKTYGGQYSKSAGKVSGIMDLVAENLFERKNFMLLTYRGCGKFDIVIFDSSKTEKMLLSRSNVNGMTYSII